MNENTPDKLYDILPIPSFPYELSLWQLLFILLLSVVALLTVRAFFRRPTLKAKNSLYDQTRIELSKLRQEMIARQSETEGTSPERFEKLRERAFDLSSLLRRYFSSKENSDFAAFSELDLRKIALHNKQPEKVLLINHIAALEQIKYSSNLKISEFTRLLEELERDLISFEHRS